MRPALLASGILVAASGVFAQTTVRFATFNASLNRGNATQLQEDMLGLSVDPQAANRQSQLRTVAEIIQRTNPDVLLVNEFDFYSQPAAAPDHPVNLFQANYLSTGQNTLSQPAGANAIAFPHRFVAPSNTGIASGFDLNNNGVVVTTPGAPGYGDDSLGFGAYPGQFGMAVYSKYPIKNVRTFRNFLWKDMPGGLLTSDPSTDDPNTPVNENLNGFYSPDEINILRLSGKSHWDVTIEANGQDVHVLTAHPTPPVFDGPEDRNGKRNYDEIRFWKDYINGAAYIYDDAGNTGGLAPDSRFVIMGDYNADQDGDAYTLNSVRAIDQLLADALVNDSLKPGSPGGPEQALLQGLANNSHTGNPLFDTADFADVAPGNLRADYVLPSRFGLEPFAAGVFWPASTDPLFPLVGTFGNPNFFAGFPSSDHRLVFADVTVPEPSAIAAAAAALAFVRRRRAC